MNFPPSSIRQDVVTAVATGARQTPQVLGACSDREGDVGIYIANWLIGVGRPNYQPCIICKTTWTSEKVCTECRNDLSGHSAGEAGERVAPAKQVGLRAVEADALLDSEGATPSTPTNVP